MAEARQGESAPAECSSSSRKKCGPRGYAGVWRSASMGAGGIPAVARASSAGNGVRWVGIGVAVDIEVDVGGWWAAASYRRNSECCRGRDGAVPGLDWNGNEWEVVGAA